MQSTAPHDVPARRGRTPRDLVLSLAVLLVPVVALALIYQTFFNGNAPRAIDVSGTFAAARQEGAFPVEQPVGLPAGWSAITAHIDHPADGSVLRVSYVSPDHSGLQLIESDRPSDALLPDELGDQAVPGDLRTIAGRRWREYPRVRGGSRALVLAGDGWTIILVGTATAEDLRTFAAALG